MKLGTFLNPTQGFQSAFFSLRCLRRRYVAVLYLHGTPTISLCASDPRSSHAYICFPSNYLNMKLVSPYTYELLRGLLCSPTVCPIADSVPHRHSFCTVAMPRRLRPATWAANTAELPCPVGLFWPYVTSSAKQTELATTTADQRQSLFATVRVTGARWVPLASTHGLRRRGG